MVVSGETTKSAGATVIVKNALSFFLHTKGFVALNFNRYVPACVNVKDGLVWVEVPNPPKSHS